MSLLLIVVLLAFATLFVLARQPKNQGSSK